MSVCLFARSLPFVLAGALLAGPVLAQSAAPPPSAAPASAAPATPAAAKAHTVVEKRIDTLRARLKITPDQSKAFDDFAEVMREAANRMDALLNSQAKGLPNMSAVDHMKAYQAITQARADDMQREVPAFSHLYDTLTPVQRKAADDSFREAVSGSRRR